MIVTSNRIPIFVFDNNKMEEKVVLTPVDKYIINPVNRFISKSTTGGIVLFIAAIIAIILANSSFSESYHHFWENKFGFTFNGTAFLNYSIHHWVNDGLMAIFFFVVGLELKRELIGGELSTPKNALLPIIAAIGGMVVPALIYAFFNYGTETSHGWGIPMATDIAFALGVLYLLGDRIPTSLKVFLTALAIVDDLGAVLVIAIFYTAEIDYYMLFTGLSFVVFLFLSKALGARNTVFYAVIGIFGVWLPFLLSGVHATIAAVLVAFTIPASSRIKENVFADKINLFLNQFKFADKNNKVPTLTSEQLHVLDDIRIVTKDAMTPLQRLEHCMHPFVSFIIMPIFAFANAGIDLRNVVLAQMIANPIHVGIVLGLFVGKPLGITLFSYLAVLFGLSQLPLKTSWIQIVGVSLLGGIGFTMALFISARMGIYQEVLYKQHGKHPREALYVTVSQITMLTFDLIHTIVNCILTKIFLF
ncbi:MAG: Na+/H+ antiporter NhaA [Pedobacter sp.]|nr:MAG: Na+/H+ antiporter NhaA [Pedobacter sp.]